ncbi:hypothetical protein [Maledivibacter halophilus]|nr:hypothetical protein [Maledivibacter halophilus]
MEVLSKKYKKKLKQFSLNEKTDFIIYLQELIVRTDKCLVKMKRNLDNLAKLIKKHDMNELEEGFSGEIIVPSEKYGMYVDLLSNNTSYLLNLIGDQQNSSISYKKFRYIIDRRIKKKSLKFEIREIDEEVNKILCDLNKMRNWFNHVPESLLLSEIELIREGKLNSHKLQPIEIYYPTYCSLNVVKDLYETSFGFYNICRKIHQNAKKDYSSLIGKSVTINRISIDEPKTMEYFEATKLSSDVQGIKGYI